MATSSEITMLREISAAGDRERTGALDVEWDGAHATLFFMFGHPSHVVFETAEGRKLDGEAALDAIVDELPAEFRVAPWRRAMVTDDTLHCSAEDLMGLFQRRNAVAESNGQTTEDATADVAPSTETEATAEATAESPPATPSSPAPAADQPPFGLRDFPLLPLATALWTDAAANVAGLEAAVPRLPDSLLVLAGPTSQGAALIAGGRVTDAVWVNAAGGRLGDAAAHAVMTSLEGTITAYAFDDLRLLTALPMLWRSPRLGSGLPAGWLHTDDVVAEVRTSGRSCGLIVDSADPGVALFAAGELVAVYTAGQQWPATSMAALRTLLHEPGARVSVLGEVAADASPAGGDDAPASAATVVDVPEAAEAPAPVVEAPAVAEEPASVADEAPAFVAEEPASVVDEAPAFVAEEAAVAEAPAVADAADVDAGSTAPASETPDTTDVPARGGRLRRRGRGRADAKADVADADAADATADVAAEAAPAEPAAEVAEPAADDQPVAYAAVDDVQAGADVDSDVAPLQPGESDLRFEPAVFTIADLSAGSTPLPTGAYETEPVPASTETASPSSMDAVEQREATEFVPARLDFDVDALRTELTNIATVWLGEDDAAPVAQAIAQARPGVDDFVSTIATIGAMEIPGHETAVVRAMAREMHFRASEVLCGV